MGRPQIPTRHARIRRLLGITGVCTLLLLTGIAVFGALKVRSISQKLPSVASLADTRSHPLTTIVSSDGVLLATFETHYRRPVGLEQVAPSLIAATLATEDARFYSHQGVDLRGIARAVFCNISSGTLAGQGGSTITQQLARNLYLTNQKTLERKVEEMLLAQRIERAYSKHDILEAYLNTIYYGNGCYGIEAASQAYFHKPARDLVLGEAALLAGLPQRPAAYSPVQHMPVALRRRAEVLNRMVSTGAITAQDASRAAHEPTHVFRPHLQAQTDWKAPYFVAHVLTAIRDRFGAEALYSGMRIVTTLNWQVQKAAEMSLREGLSRGLGPNTGAIVAIDPRNGAIRALVGGADFRRDQFDAALQGVRQPGSAFKPIVYAAAFDTNACSLANMLDDKKLVYHSSPRDWVVHNYDGGYRGTVSVLEAIRQSINTIAIQVAEQTGVTTVQAYAQRLGISTPMSTDLPLALGASGVHPIDLCSAFSAFANGGARYDPYCIQQTTDPQDRESFRDDPATRLHEPFMNPKTVDQINVALREVVVSGTGMAASAIADAHGKTGTTSSHRDAWFVGYTGGLATAVWMAHVEKHASTDGHIVVSYLPMPGATGGRICVPVWARFMRLAQPVQARVDLAHGAAASIVAQPGKDILFAELQGSVSQTGIEEARRPEEGQAAGDPAMTDAWGVKQQAEPQPETGPAIDVDAPRIDAPSGQGDAISPDPDDANMRRDMQDGYRDVARHEDSGRQ